MSDTREKLSDAVLIAALSDDKIVRQLTKHIAADIVGQVEKATLLKAKKDRQKALEEVRRLEARVEKQEQKIKNFAKEADRMVDQFGVKRLWEDRLKIDCDKFVSCLSDEQCLDLEDAIQKRRSPPGSVHFVKTKAWK